MCELGDGIAHVVTFGRCLAHDVEEVLRALDIDPGDRKLIEVWNKVDRLDAAAREQLVNVAERRPADNRPAIVSALTGEGLDRLFDAIEARLATRRIVLDLVLDPADGAGVSWLYRNAEVLTKDMDEDGKLAMTVRADPDKAARVRAKFGV
jgi:GTP-binding protein HflX